MRRLRKSAGLIGLPIPLSDGEIDARFRETQSTSTRRPA